MNLSPGYYVTEFRSLGDDVSRFKRIGMVSWLRTIKRRTVTAYSDLLVIGLERLLTSVDDPAGTTSYVRKLLRDSSDFLVNCGAIFVFPVDGNLEVWTQPIIRTDVGVEIDLVPLFGNIRQIDVRWFYQQLNLLS